jgi:outer membrane lipoprotein carrier protein
MKPFAQRLTVASFALLLFVPGARAESEAGYAQDFFNELHTLQADFDQQVVDSNHNIQQSSQGHMWIKRPGQFRWDYNTPYRQQIVADGERLWSYDEDLEQVTVQKVADVLTSTPAMLLSGDQPLEDVFVIKEHVPGNSARQVLLTPKSGDSNVTAITLYFDAGTLARIQALDEFGNTTIFSFTNLERNHELDPHIFRFTPPANADVVGDAG